jgi:hypothetical protein
MSHRHPGHTPGPKGLSLRKVLVELAGVLVLLLGVKVMDFVHWAGWPKADARNLTTASRHPARPVSPLQWRSPWWAWQLLSWNLATLTAPTFLVIGGLLVINPHSDHPLFWWSLPGIVAISNAMAILCTNQQHHRDPFTDRQALARRYAVAGMLAGAMLFLLVGSTSGFLSEIVGPLSGAATAAFPAITTSLCSAAAAVAFGALSFTHAGVLHSTLGFEVPAPFLGPHVIA